MTYDDWKLETPEEEDYRLGAAGRKRRNRAEYEEEHADDLREEEDHRRKFDTRAIAKMNVNAKLQNLWSTIYHFSKKAGSEDFVSLLPGIESTINAMHELK